MCWFFWDVLVFLGCVGFLGCAGFSHAWDAIIFCNNFARWLQTMIATCDGMCWFFWDAMIFCNNFARWLQKIVATCDVMWCDVMRWFLSEATIFCNNFARWLQKIVATRPRNPRFQKCSYGHETPFGWQKEQSGFVDFWVWSQHVMRCVGFSGMPWSFVTTLQDDYKR